MEETRKKRIEINVDNVNDSRQLQMVLKESLGFPDFYGKNWYAFWDAITGLVQLPEKIVFVNWKSLERSLPKEASYLEKVLNRYNEENPEDNWKVDVEYK